MRKLKGIWNPNIDQDIDAITSPSSPFYDKELTEMIVLQHGSIDKFRKFMKDTK